MRTHRSTPCPGPLLAAMVVVLMTCVSACYHVRSRLLLTPVAPDVLYRCLQVELGKAGYAIVGADRASGWVKAQKRTHGSWRSGRAEIYATVIPDEQGDGSHLQLTDNSDAKDDAEKLWQACGS